LFIAALIPGQVERAQFAAAVTHDHRVEFCADGAALIAVVTTRAVDVVVTTPRDQHGLSVAPTLRLLSDQHPSLPLVLYLSLNSGDVHDAVALAADLQTRMVIVREHDDMVGAIAAAGAGVGVFAGVNAIVSTVERLAPPPVRAALVYAARHGHRALRVPVIATHAGISARRLAERLRELGMPPAVHLLQWIRVLHAAARLQLPGGTVEQVASQLGFSSSSTLKHLMKRVTGVTATELRARGGLPYLLVQFERRVIVTR
jgi:AraC-like DNA-binding protein